jgi:hypothetical protein
MKLLNRWKRWGFPDISILVAIKDCSDNLGSLSRMLIRLKILWLDDAKENTFTLVNPKLS